MQSQRLKSYLLFFIIVNSLSLYAQDEMTLLNGKIIKGKILSQDEEMLKYEMRKKNGNTKERAIEKERIYKIDYAGLPDEIIYRQDSLMGNYYSVDEMQRFIKGEQDAMAKYNSKGSQLGGFIFGVGGGLLYPAIGIFSPLVPIAYTFAGSMFRTRIWDDKVSNPEYLNYPEYIAGYERAAKSKKIQRTLKSAGIGFLIGLTTGLIIYEKNN